MFESLESFASQSFASGSFASNVLRAPRAALRPLVSFASTCCVVAFATAAAGSAADLALPPLPLGFAPGAPSYKAPARKTAVRPKDAAKASVRVALDPTLLRPLAAPDCTFMGTVSNPPTDEQTRQRLDYEAQCYRQAEALARWRLDALQEAVNKMMAGSAQQPANLATKE